VRIETDLIRRYFDSVNAEDWTAMASLLHPDATFSTPGARPRAGRDQVLQLFGRIFTRWDTHLDTPEWQIAEGVRAVVGIAFEGRTASGLDVSFSALDVFTFEDDLIRAVVSWYDSLEVFRLMSGAPGDA
jgi:ketosteroid isomerase-like protein